MKVIVVGAGVNGLSCAIALAERGQAVRVIARERPSQTTSAIAAAIWYPYFAEPEEKVRAWGSATLRELQRLAREVPESGVRLVRGRKLFHRRMGPPWWARFVDDFELLNQARVGSAARAGYGCSLPVADTTVYLPYLQARLERAGGTIETAEVKDLHALTCEADRVVNCTGLGARALCDDRTLFPIRGQVVAVPGTLSGEFLLDTDNPAGLIYVIPRLHDTILGGTAQKGDDSLVPRSEEAAAIRARTFPDAPAGVNKVGLRPGRPAVRLERDGLIIHNYGHGGSGVTLSWGCAAEVADLCLA